MTEKTKVYKKCDTKPSQMFEDSMAGGGIGSDELTCEHCNRLHLCPDYEPDNNWDNYDTRDEDREAHRKYCEEEHKKNPDGVVLHYDCDAIIGRYLDNCLFVLGCPCNGLYRYENFIWENKDTIRNYLRDRIQQEYEWAQQELTKNKLTGISK